MPLPKEQAWFPAKRYGYGWGLPCRWQGWVALLAYLAAFLAALRWIPPGGGRIIGFMLVLTALLVALCWWKGEPARWRWGDDR
jgi:hypothetical protein